AGAGGGGGPPPRGGGGDGRAASRRRRLRRLRRARRRRRAGPERGLLRRRRGPRRRTDRRGRAVSDAGGDGAVARLEAALGYRFRDQTLAATALCHASHSHEVEGVASNERLAFLGDAVLGPVPAEELYRTHADWAEGELTRARAALVNGAALARCARELGLGALVRLGRTEQRSGGADKDTILANCFEAVVGAVYLDGGVPPAAARARPGRRAPPQPARGPQTPLPGGAPTPAPPPP